MGNIILSPPIAFMIILLVTVLMAYSSKLIAAHGTASSGKGEAYGCGENVDPHQVNPDYAQFFSFAFFFTIMHVVVLIVSTMPGGFSLLAFAYILIAVMALFILFRK